MPHLLHLPNELLLQISEDIELPEDLYSLIHTCPRLACFEGFALRKFVSEGHSGLTALQWAAHKGSEGLVRFLLEKGVGIDYFESKFLCGRGRPAIHHAVLSRNSQIISILVQAGGDVDARNARGDTTLHVALENNYREAVEILLGLGAEINAYDSRGQRPINIAARTCDINLVAMLLERGADVNSETVKSSNIAGRTPLHDAIKGIHRDCSSDPRTEIVGFLLGKGANPSAQDRYGQSPLHYAVKGYKTIHALRLLLINGADMEAVNQFGKRVLVSAIFKHHDAAVKVLVEAGVDIAAKNADGLTAADIAVTKLDSEVGHRMIKLLLHSSEQIKKYLQARPNGGDVFYWAAESGHEELVRQFVDCGVDILARNQNGLTALEFAIKGQATGVISFLALNISCSATMRDKITSFNFD